MRTLAALVISISAAGAFAQCQGWLPNLPGTDFDGPVFALNTWDPDGAGPQQPWLIVGGDFTTTGAVAANHIAAWDGSQWRAFGAGIEGPVYALTTYNGELIAGGYFDVAGTAAVSNVARWSASTGWRAIGNSTFNGPVFALNTIAGELVAGGDYIFQTDGNTPSRSAARWNGSVWRVYPTTPQIAQCNAMVRTVTGILYFATDDYAVMGSNAPGSSWGLGVGGPPAYALHMRGGDLLVGGSFSGVSPSGSYTNVLLFPASGPYRPLSPGPYLDGPVYALTSLSDRVFLGGTFSRFGTTPAPNCASWREQDGWSPMAGGTDGPVLSMFAWNNQIFVGGAFQSTGAGTGPYFARWSDLAAPVISQHPQSHFADLAGTTSFTVAASVPVGALSYSWFHDNSPIADGPGGITPFGGVVSGAHTPTLTITGITPTDAGVFTCEVSNGCAAVTSSPAQLVVTPECEADYNHDGAVNGFDLEALEKVINGEPCP